MNRISLISIIIGIVAFLSFSPCILAQEERNESTNKIKTELVVEKEWMPSFPIGLHMFHKAMWANFQLNRWYTFGVARNEDFMEAASRINSMKDWKREMVRIADKAFSEKRLINAAFYYRAAEFYTLPSDPDKERLYDRFIEVFNTAFRNQNIERFKVPYENGFLPGMRLRPKSGEKRGIILLHGGWDSIIEELYPLGRYLANFGYEIIMFDGPGQGGALHKHKLALTHEWEKPVSAVLDYFRLKDVTLIGMSLGGYLCMRAAAFEPRISRVISWNVIYDWYECFWRARGDYWYNMYVPLLEQGKKEEINNISEGLRKNSYEFEFAFSSTMHVTGKNNVFDSLVVLKKYTMASISSLIKQDVLLTMGTEDVCPMEMYYKQKEALTNARSVTGRIFTAEENAQYHCQAGNIKLALDVMLDWINQISKS